MHHGINYTTRHRYLGTSSHSPRPRSAVYLGSRRITVHYRGNPVPSRQNHDRPQGQAHSTALRIPLPDVLSHRTTIPNLRLGVPGSNPRSKTLGLPIEMCKTPRLLHLWTASHAYEGLIMILAEYENGPGLSQDNPSCLLFILPCSSVHFSEVLDSCTVQRHQVVNGSASEAL